MSDEDKISIECPNCGKRFAVRESTLGHAVKCTKCARSWKASAPAAAAAQPAPSVARTAAAVAARSAPASGRSPTLPKRNVAMEVSLNDEDVGAAPADEPAPMPAPRRPAANRATPPSSGKAPVVAPSGKNRATPPASGKAPVVSASGKNRVVPTSGKNSVVAAAPRNSVSTARAKPPTKGSPVALYAIIGVVLLACGAGAFFMLRGTGQPPPAAVADAAPKKDEPKITDQPPPEPMPKTPVEEPPTPSPQPPEPVKIEPAAVEDRFAKMGARCEELSKRMDEKDIRNPFRLLRESQEYLLEIKAVNDPKAEAWVKYLTAEMNRFKENLSKGGTSAGELFQPDGIRKRLAALDTGDETAIRAGREALLEVIEPNLVQVIYGELTDNPKPQVRAAIAEMVALREEPDAAASLFVAMQLEKDGEAKQRMCSALCRKTGTKFGPDETDKWKDYFRNKP